MKSLYVLFFLGITCLVPGPLSAQTLNLTAKDVDTGSVQALPNHHPAWASAKNDFGPTSPGLPLDHLTLVLARSSAQEEALKKLLADQQNPASPDYHRWLTPAEMGKRFGPSDQDIEATRNWLQSQGLHVNWVASSRMFIGFGGSAADVGRAFKTEFHNYGVRGVSRMSVSSAPMLPAAIAPLVKSVHGLYTIVDAPQHSMTGPEVAGPQLTLSSGAHYIAPADFQTIYNGVTSYSGYQKTIGIVGRSRTNPADFNNFMQKTQSSFQMPKEIVPTEFGGVDPGPAYTSETQGAAIGDQMEATLDVTRAGSVAPNANLLLVSATQASGGVEVAMQYLVQTTPLPAQVVSISYGACEAEAGQSGVNYWDALFQQAAAEGISVFVASGDSGASGCEDAFATPVTNPGAISPSYICSSGYATCVGGTEFNDAGNPVQYWNTSNGSSLASARLYIPEGAWNEPLNSKSSPQVAGSGGGVSSFIPTPAWQAGTGVPAARTGRYTPDVSFTSSCHDAYFGCMAALGASCVSGSDGSFRFAGFCGTSAAAPSLAGVAALLDEKSQIPQGNINPQIYAMAANSPSTFHDSTPATSGVASCDIHTPSMCNNSTPGPTGLSGGQAGYPLTVGYDLVTGVGSPDILNFVGNFGTALPVPTVTLTPSSNAINAVEGLKITIAVAGGAGQPIPSGTVELTDGQFTASDVALVNGTATVVIPAGTLTGSIDIDTFSAQYFPDDASAAKYSTAIGTCAVAVNLITPTMSVSATPSNTTTAQAIAVKVTVTTPNGAPTPTGDILLQQAGTSNTYSSTLANGTVTITIPAGALPPGSDWIDVYYNPDVQSQRYYARVIRETMVTVAAGPMTTPTVKVTFSPPAISFVDGVNVTVTVVPASGGPTPSGIVNVTSPSINYGNLYMTLKGGTATKSLPGGSLPAGNDTFTANYPGDYNNHPVTGTATIAVSKVTPTISIDTNGLSSISTYQSLYVAVHAVSGTGPGSDPTGTVTLTSGTFTSQSMILENGGALVLIPAGSLTPGTAMLEVQYTGDGNYNPASGSASIEVTNVLPSFAISGTNVTIATRGATTGNVSTITVTPTAGFTGIVTLSASVTASPAGAQYLPTFNFGTTNPVQITSTTLGTATLTISTTAATHGALSYPVRGGNPWSAIGGAALGCILLIGIPGRRRRWQTFLGMAALFATLSSGILACGGGGGSSSKGGGNGGTTVAGTTPGTYTVKIIGNSSTNTDFGVLTVTVQ